jgi:hypothetical protein
VIREFISGEIESITGVLKENNNNYRIVTLLLPSQTDLEKFSPQLFEDSLQDAIIDGVMTSDEAEEIRKKAGENVKTEIIFYNPDQLKNLKAKDFVYIIAEPYSGSISQDQAKGSISQGIFITDNAAEFQKAKFNAFREMEKERHNWKK